MYSVYGCKIRFLVLQTDVIHITKMFHFCSPTKTFGWRGIRTRNGLPILLLSIYSPFLFVFPFQVTVEGILRTDARSFCFVLEYVA